MLEELIIKRLIDTLDSTISIYDMQPMSTISDANNASMSLHNTPAVHVFEKSRKILKQVGASTSCAMITYQTEIWVVIVVKMTYDNNTTRLALDEWRRKVMEALTFWNPNVAPFLTRLEWGTEEVQIFHDDISGMQYAMTIHPKGPFVEAYELKSV